MALFKTNHRRLVCVHKLISPRINIACRGSTSSVSACTSLTTRDALAVPSPVERHETRRAPTPEQNDRPSVPAERRQFLIHYVQPQATVQGDMFSQWFVQTGVRMIHLGLSHVPYEILYHLLQENSTKCHHTSHY